MDRKKNIESLKSLYEAHTTLLEKLRQKQDEVLAGSSAYKEDLHDVQKSVDIS